MIKSDWTREVRQEDGNICDDKRYNIRIEIKQTEEGRSGRNRGLTRIDWKRSAKYYSVGNRTTEIYPKKKLTELER